MPDSQSVATAGRWCVIRCERLAPPWAMKSMLATLLCRCATVCQAQTAGVPSVQVAKDKKAFTLSPSDKAFTSSCSTGSSGARAAACRGLPWSFRCGRKEVGHER